MPPRNYGDQVRQFEDDYGLEAGRIEKLFSAQNAKASEKTPAQQYQEGLMTLLSEYAESCIKPVETSSTYLMSYDYIKSMISGYEALMQARHEQMDPGQPREKYNGALQQVVDGMQDMLKNTWDKSLVSSWAARIKDGTYDISELRKITQKAYTAGKDYFIDKFADKKEGDENVLYINDYVDDEFESIASPGETVFMMREAMQRVTESRSTRWYWNPLNWLQAIKESLYMRELNKQVKGPKGNLSPMNDNAASRAESGWIYGDERKDLFSMLKKTSKELREEAERIEHRRKQAEAKAEKDALEKANSEALKQQTENNRDNVIANDKQNEPMIEPVVFQDEFKEPDAKTEPPIKDTESLSKEHSIEH